MTDVMAWLSEFRAEFGLVLSLTVTFAALRFVIRALRSAAGAGRHE